MVIVSRSLALIFAITGVAALSAQQPKRELPKVLPVFAEFKSIDVEKKTITIETQDRKQSKSYPLADSFEVTHSNGAKLKPTDLSRGDLIALTIDPESKKVTSIGIPTRSNATRGAFKEVNLEKNTITIEIRENEAATFLLANFVEIRLVSKQNLLELSDLIKGDKLTLTFDATTNKVKRIVVEPAFVPPGTIKEIDLEKRIIVISPNRAPETESRWPLGKPLTVTMNLREFPIGDVKPGMQVTASLGDDRKTIARLSVRDSAERGNKVTPANLRAVDAEKRTITIATSKEPSITLKVPENTVVKIKDKEGKLSDLPVGTTVLLMIEKDTVLSVFAYAPHIRSGIISNIDLTKNRIAFKVWGESVECTLNAKTKIQQVLTLLKPKDLKEGQVVTFEVAADKKSLTSIIIIENPKR